MARLTIAKAYERVNGAWPETVPPITAEEAVRAAKRLYRFAMGETWTGPVVVTSGNRYTQIRWIDGVRTLVVNPDEGWKRMVHVFSHDLYWRANPGEKPHSKDHARVERKMIEQVVRRGWLEGKLKSTPKPKPVSTKLDAIVDTLAVLDGRIEEWESRAKRAANALKKLHDRRKALVRRIEREEQGTEREAA